MANRRVTSLDVAKLAGVSRTTVSFVLNGVNRIQISSETRQKVLDAVVTLGYVPNATAQALVNQRTHVIGLVLSRSPNHIASDAFVPQVLNGMLEVARANKLRLMIDIVEPEHQERAYLELVRANHIDGIVFSGPRVDDKALKNLENEAFPTVLMGDLPGSSFCSVDVDNREAAHEAVKYLISLGHRRIACITHAPLSFSAAADRLAGYQQALDQAGVPYETAMVREGNFEPESGCVQMRSLLEAQLSFTAVFVTSDTVLMGAKSAIREAGLRIPDDISLVGFDDIIWSSYSDPPISTVHLPAFSLGREACIMLSQILNDQPIVQRNLILPTEFIVRNSCRAL